MNPDCPLPECRVEFDHLKTEVGNLNKSRRYLETEMGKRMKTTSLVAIAILAVGILSGLLSSLWVQTDTISCKVDKIREYQVRVLTVLELKGLLEAAEMRKAATDSIKDGSE